MADAETAKSMELEGNLNAFKFPEILQFLGRGRMTGVLSVSRGETRIEITFNDGKIVGAISTDRALRIGEALVYAGLITRQSMEEALEAQDSQEPKPFLGQILTKRGYIEEQALKDFVELQVKEEVWDLFSWEEGNFRFEQGDIREPGTVQFGLEIEPLLLEGSRRQDEWEAIRTNVGGWDDIWFVNPDFEGKTDVEVDQKMWQVLSFINGRLCAGDIVRISNLGKFDTFWALDQLIRADLIVGDNEREDRHVAEDSTRIPSVKPKSPALEAASHPDSEDSNASEGSSSLFGFLGKKKKQAPSAEPEEAETSLPVPAPVPGDYLTDVSVVCAAVNQLIDSLGETGKFAKGAAGSQMVSGIWRNAEQKFPKADIIEFNEGQLLTNRFDRYAKLEGTLSNAVSGCHEDSLQALSMVWSELMGRASGSIDSKSVRQIAERAIQPYLDKTPEIAEPDFSLRRWADPKK